MVRTIAVLLLAVALTACPTIRSSSAGAFEVEGTYVHPPSRLEFPVDVGTFRRAEMNRFTDDGTDVGVGYNHEASGASVAFTVYVSPPWEKAKGQVPGFDHRFDAELDAIREHHAGAKLQSSKDVSLFWPGNFAKGRVAEFAYREVFSFREQDVVSRIYLFERDGWIVEYRVTWALAQQAVAQPLFETFLANAPWGCAGASTRAPERRATRRARPSPTTPSRRSRPPRRAPARRAPDAEPAARA